MRRRVTPTHAFALERPLNAFQRPCRSEATTRPREGSVGYSAGAYLAIRPQCSNRLKNGDPIVASNNATKSPRARLDCCRFGTRPCRCEAPSHFDGEWPS